MQDLLHKSLGRFERHPIWKPRHFVALPAQVLVARPIPPCLTRLRVHAPVKFDDEPAFNAAEVDNEASNRMLAAKLEPFETQVSQNVILALASYCILERRMEVQLRFC